jgi:hypothetical protein
MSISPNVPTPEESYRYEGTAVGTPRWIAVLFVLLIIALGVLAYLGYAAQSRIESNFVKSQEQNRLLTAELDQTNARLADIKGHIDVSEQKMHLTQAELANARSRSESFRKDQLAEDQKLADQINQTQAGVTALGTDLGSAKKDIEATRTDLETTKGKLDRATGDMGVMSGLIAHNRDDLEDLKRRGDRNYYEFKITKSKTPQKVGPVQVSLNKTDPKKSKYTVTVFVDDRSIEKKDRTAGEPVQFYVRGSSHMPPYEFVVFDVGKNEITGYLATPKEPGAQPAPVAASPSAANTKPQL